MKVNAEIDLNVAMGAGSHCGTGCQEYLPDETVYDELLRVFGDPQIKSSPDGKIQVEWYGRINGLQFTIYDYKSPVEPERNTDWHISGKHKFAADMVNLYFKNSWPRHSCAVYCL